MAATSGSHADHAPSSSTCVALSLVVMVSLAHLNRRVLCLPSGAFRILLGSVLLLTVVLYLSGVHRTLHEIVSLVAGPAGGGARDGVNATASAGPDASERPSLRTAAGIALFCSDLQAIAARDLIQVLLLLTTLYVVLQTFCIPGTVVLNAAFGAIVGTLVAVPYCTLLGTLGASSCYLMSRAVGLSLVEAVDHRLMKGRGIVKIRHQVTKYRSDLLVYLLFLRLTPILPNWLVNLASPVVGVPLHVFAMSTAIGIVPQTYLTVRFGTFAALAAQRIRARRRHGSGSYSSSAAEEALPSMVTAWDTLLLAVVGVAILFALRLKKRFAAAKTDRGTVYGENASKSHRANSMRYSHPFAPQPWPESAV